MRLAHLCTAVVLTGTSLTGGVASAYTISFSDSIPMMLTDWSDAVSIPKFDPSLGALLGVEFTLAQAFEGAMGFENLDGDNPSSYTLRLSWDMELQRPDNTGLVTIQSLREETGVVDPFDGVLDFAGPSGVTFDIAVEESADASAAPGDLPSFIGPGTIDLPVIATSDSYVAGGSPGASFFSAAAAAEVTVTYTYIPEPASLSMLAIGSLAMRRRRRDATRPRAISSKLGVKRLPVAGRADGRSRPPRRSPARPG